MNSTFPPQVTAQVDLVRQQAPLFRALSGAGAVMIAPGVQSLIKQHARLMQPFMPMMQMIERMSR